MKLEAPLTALLSSVYENASRLSAVGVSELERQFAMLQVKMLRAVVPPWGGETGT